MCQCFEFMKGTFHGQACPECVVFKQGLYPCFVARSLAPRGCDVPCSECRFYTEIFFQRLQVVHQFAWPAAIFKGLNIWAGNQAFADLCGMSTEDLIDAGIDLIVHGDSLTEVVSEFKRMDMEGLTRTRIIDAKLNWVGGAIGAKVNVTPLTEPEGAFFLLID